MQNDEEMKLLDRLTFLDTTSGLAFCANSVPFYEEMLRTFLVSDRRDELSNFYEQADWENYQVVVHALKSTSMTIGAIPLSTQAKDLELAVRDGKVKEIRRRHADLMQSYHRIMLKIEKALSKSDPLEEEENLRKLIELETTILMVDDDEINRKVAQKILGEHYTVDCVTSGGECLAYLEENNPNLIMLDVHMPGMDGYTVLAKIKDNPKTKDIPVVVLTADTDRDAELKALEVGAVDFMSKPFIAELMLQRVHRLVELQQLQRFLQKEVEKQSLSTEKIPLSSVITLADAIDAKDSYTNGHSTRVAEYSVILAKELGWEEAEIENLRFAALLHDIGKIGVSDAILNKPSKLTEEEYDQIKAHTKMGGDILKNIQTIPGAEEIARYHHERYDGSGYPEGKCGEEIPLKARIVGIADAYDAMNSRRIYRNALSPETIRRELKEGCGKQFDPKLLPIFLELFDNHKLDLDVNQTEKIIEERPVQDTSGMILQKVMQTLAQQKNKEEMDFLTGLPLRRMGQSKIAKAMQEKPGCLAFIDIDNLKKINDTMGHKAGDIALKLMGDIIAKHSNNAVACRLGGDEFLFFMQGCTKTEARVTIEAIFQDFKDSKEKEVAIHPASLSAGLCMTKESDMFEEACNKADKALYFVKQNGKAGYYFYQKEEIGKPRSTEINMAQLIQGLRNSGHFEGPMDVEFREFAKIFQYVTNIRERYNHDFHLILITLENVDKMRMEELEQAMNEMEFSIAHNIRNVDVCTRYSSVQFLVILFEVGEDNITGVVERIFSDFSDHFENETVRPTYIVNHIENA